MKPSVQVGLALVAAITAFPTALPGAPASFDPEEHFPKESFFFASIDMGLLRTSFKETPFGKILMHPGVEKAFAGARAKLLEELLRNTQDFQQVTGLDLIQTLDLFEGKVALTIPGVDMAGTTGGPQMVFSAGLGTKRKEIESLLGRLGAAFLASTGGGEATTSDVKGIQVTSWPVQFGPSIQHAIIGDAVVFSAGESLEAVITRYQAREPSQDSLRSNEVYARAKVQASLSSPVATVFLNYGKIYATLQQVIGFAPDGDKILKAMAAVGVDKLSSVLYRVGMRDGDFEAKLFLDSPGGLSGFLGALAECLGPGEDEAALSRIPAGSLEIGSQSIALGRLARAIVDLRSGIPDAAPAMDAFLSKLEEVTGLSMEGDIYSLPRLSIYSFNALPPGGGFVPDQCAIVRRSQFQSYLVALDKFARKAGAAVKRVSMEGRDVAYLSMSRLGFPALVPGANSVTSADLDASVSTDRVILKGGLSWQEPSLTLAFAPIDSEWMVVASTPQAVGRYFSSYSKAPSVTADETTAALIRKEMGKDASFSVLRGGRHLVYAWNTALALAMFVAPTLEKKLEEIGIDPAHLPPGEELAPAFRDGFFLMRRSADGCLIHGHRVLSNLIGSPTMASALLAIGLQAEASKNAAAGGGIPLAEERLQKLGQALRRHAETAGNGAYPRDDDQGLPSLQVLVDEGLVAPGDLVHPRGERPASPDASGKVTLDREHVSYELVSWKQGPTDSPGRLLAYEKKAYEGNGRRALFVDTSVRFLEESEFQKLLEEQRSRYGKAQPEKEGE